MTEETPDEERDAVPTWAALFDRAAGFDADQDDVREALSEVRSDE